MSTILILGGTGKAGFQIAVELLRQAQFTVFLSGSNEEKCRDSVDKLHQQFPNQEVYPYTVHLNEQFKLANAFEQCDLVVNCVPFDPNHTPVFRQAVESGTHYIDIVPSAEKHTVLKNYAELLVEKGLIYILDTGFNPGLTLALANYSYQLLDEVEKATLGALYKDPRMPEGSACDILREAHREPLVFEDGRWQGVNFMKMSRIVYPSPFGKRLSFPIYAPEMARFPEKAVLRTFEMYQGRFNWGVNLLLFWWKILGLGFDGQSIKRGAKLFQWLNKNLTWPPYGGALQLLAIGRKAGKSDNVDLGISTRDLYKATALPVVGTVLQWQEGRLKPGIMQMGEGLVLEDFFKFLEKNGLPLFVNQ